MTINSSSTIWVILAVLYQVNGSNAQQAPSITSVEQIDSESVRVRWNDNNIPNLIRYRVFYESKDSNGNLKEWPSQIEKVNKQLIGDSYYEMEVASTFSCYANCIRNPTCDFAVFSGSNHCSLKKYNPSRNLKINATGNIPVYGEYINIPKYRNEAVVKNLPVNRDYRFRVAILKKDGTEFSDMSDLSESIKIQPMLKIHSDLTDENKVKIHWRQDGKFRDLKISRYTVMVWSDEHVEQYSVTNDLAKSELSHDYFDGKSVKSVGPVADEIECFVECVKKNDCIRYLMFTSKECCLMTSLDLQASIYKPENTKTSSLINHATHYVLENLRPNVTYKVSVEFITMYGDIGSSNNIEVVQSKNKRDIDIEVPVESLKPTEQETTTITTSTTTTSTTSSTTTTSTAKTGDDYYYDDFYNDLNEILPKERVTNPPTTTTTTTEQPQIANDDHDYNDYYSTEDEDSYYYDDSDAQDYDLKKTTKATSKFKPIIEISNDVIIQRIGGLVEINCISYGDDQNTPMDISWKTVGRLLKTTKIVRSNTIENKLKFKVKSRRAAGIYKCISFDDSSLFKSVKIIVESSPSQPIITNITIHEASTLVKWELTDLGGAVIPKVIIEWSADFSKKETQISKMIVTANESPEINLNEVSLNTVIPMGSFVRITLENDLDELSKVSRLFEAECRNMFYFNTEKCHSDSAKKGEIKTKDTNSNQNTKRAFNSSTITLLSIIAVLLVLICCYVIHDCANKNNIRKLNLKDENNKRYNKVPNETEI